MPSPYTELYACENTIHLLLWCRAAAPDPPCSLRAHASHCRRCWPLSLLLSHHCRCGRDPPRGNGGQNRKSPYISALFTSANQHTAEKASHAHTCVYGRFNNARADVRKYHLHCTATDSTPSTTSNNRPCVHTGTLSEDIASWDKTTTNPSECGDKANHNISRLCFRSPVQ